MSDIPTIKTDSQNSNYVLLVFLMVLNIMNFVDRQLLSSFANFIKPELGLSDTQWGLLTGLFFIFFYAFMGLIAGALADRVHRPSLIAAGVALWSILTAASGAAKGFVSLAIPRLFIGVGESVLTPASLSMLADKFPSRLLGFASGFYYMGVPIGVGLSFLIAGYLGPIIGWRNCFYLLGVIGIIFALAALLISENPDHGKAPASANLGGSNSIIKEIIFILKSSHALSLTIAGGIIFHIVLGAAGAFDQLWLVNERGFEKVEILVITGWVATVAGILGSLFGGIAGDYWQKITNQGRPMLLFWIMIVTTPFNIAYRIVEPSSWLFWVGLATGYFMLGCFYGPTFSTIQELSPSNRRSTMTAFYILMLNLVGLGVGISSAGIAVDLMRQANVADPYTIMLVGATLISTLSIPLFFMAGKLFNQEKRV